MLQIAICDDTTDELEAISALTNEYAAAQGLAASIAAFASADELLLAIDGGRSFDAMLLDVCMPGLSGIDLAKELKGRKLETPVVFLTTSKDYALDAYGVHALRYLLKPIQKAEFDEAMEHLTALLSGKVQRSVTLKTEDGARRLIIDEILYCEASKNYTLFHLENEIVRVRGTLDSHREKLPQCPELQPLGASYLVNLAHVRELGAKSLTLDDGAVLPVPRRVYAEFRSAYMDFYFKED